MKAHEADALESLATMTSRLLRQLPEQQARTYVDGLTDQQLAAVFESLSASSRLTRGEPNLLFESAAARLRGVDVPRMGSAREEVQPGGDDASTQAASN